MLECASSMAAERDAGIVLARESKQDCNAAKIELDRALKKSKRTLTETKERMEVVNADIQGLEATVKGLRDEMKSTVSEINNVTKTLKDIRSKKASTQSQAAKSLEQMQAVVTKASFDEASVASQHHTLGKYRSKHRDSRMLSQLHELGSHLSQGDGSLPAFVQVARTSSSMRGHGSSNGHLLNADKQELLRTRSNVLKGYEEEEVRLLDLMKVLQQKVKKLEGDLSDQQPALADKIRQFAEHNMTYAVTSRAIDRDTDIMASQEEECQLTATTQAKLDKLRGEVGSLLKMPATLMRRFETVSLVAETDGSLSEVPKFVQLGMENSADSRTPSLSLADEIAVVTGGSSSVPPPAAAILASMRSAASPTALNQEGPFESVAQMIRNLISSLRAEANQDVTRGQWCAESQAENVRERLAAQNRLDSLASEARWAKAARARLEGEISFLEGEVKRLEKSGTKAKERVDAEDARTTEQMKSHTKQVEVVQKTMAMLQELCADETASKTSTACAQAPGLLEKAVAKYGELDNAIFTYMASFRSMSEQFINRVKDAMRQQNDHLTVAGAASAKRGNELATSDEETRQVKENLRLIKESQAELEQSCSPRMETAEERIARRTEELEALRNALSVLEGEALP